MTVRNLIRYLQTLDQDKNIWVIYDGYAVLSPVPDKKAEEFDEKYFADDGVKQGDYFITAS